MDYRTVMHHAGVLKANSFVVTEGEKYGAMYFLSLRLQASIQVFTGIVAALKFKFE